MGPSTGEQLKADVVNGVIICNIPSIRSFLNTSDSLQVQRGHEHPEGLQSEHVIHQ